MVNYNNNPLVSLFNEFETQTGYTFAEFRMNETASASISNQPYMKQYLDSVIDNKTYKYLYDPNLSFGFRFHQRIAQIKYTDRKSPWVTIMFNTGEKTPHTRVLSHKFTHVESTENSFYELYFRKSKLPVDIVFISNSIDYLYSFLGRLNYWFDRITGYTYEQAIQYSNSFTVDYQLAAQVINITPKDLNKLDTERRGSLVTAGYSFDLIYNEFNGLPEEGHILRHIDVSILNYTGAELLNFSIPE